METDQFLAEFPPIATAQWEEAIRADLKGADPAKLVWHTEPGLDLKPFYRAEDLTRIAFADAAPGNFPYVRGTRAHGGWSIREDVRISDPEEANAVARAAPQAGAQQIDFAGARIETASDLSVLLAGLEGIAVHFADADARVLRLLLERLQKRPHDATISTGMDAGANLECAAGILAHMPLALVPFTISAEEWQERGATAAEQIGFALASGINLLAQLSDRGLPADTVAPCIGFSFATGPAYFIEIAKLRAFRLVWAQAVEACGGSRKHARARIHARTARWNQTIYDRHVNILRATTEAMSAVLGGADSVTVLPFDACVREPDESSRRLARNTQIVLREEAMLARVADPAGGSYYLEILTDSLAAQAWKLMQQIEDAGGFAKAQSLVNRILEQRIREREQAVASRKLVLTGANRFADATEQSAIEREPDSSRAAHAFDQLRLRTQRFVNSGKAIPRIVLAEIGDAKMRAARSQFVADFLACAGLPTETRRFADAGLIAQHDAALIILCSSDAEYLDIATALLTALRAVGCTTPVIIAGNPESTEQLKSLGITEFMHVRSNPIHLLAKLQHLLGIELGIEA